MGLAGWVSAEVTAVGQGCGHLKIQLWFKESLPSSVTWVLQALIFHRLFGRELCGCLRDMAASFPWHVIRKEAEGRGRVGGKDLARTCHPYLPHGLLYKVISEVSCITSAVCHWLHTAILGLCGQGLSKGMNTKRWGRSC